MDQLRQRLLDFTATPPARVWAEVESALDQDLPGVSKKLSDYSETPPPSVWEGIKSGLGKEEKRTPVIFFSKKLARLAAAAVLFFAVFMGVRYFTPAPENNRITVIPENMPPASLPVPAENTDTQDVEESPVKKDILPAHRVVKSFIKAPQAKLSAKKRDSPKKTRYTTMSNDEGQTVRMSKKVAPVFNCAEAKILAISHYCQENIKLMQEKVGSSFISPSADFAGLIDLLKTLEADK